jgi:hypothetical protein
LPRYPPLITCQNGLLPAVFHSRSKKAAKASSNESFARHLKSTWFVSDRGLGGAAMRRTVNRLGIGPWDLGHRSLSGREIAYAQEGSPPTAEELVKRLECHDNQSCQSPPASRRRGFQTPQGRRGITFEPFTEEERKKLDEVAKSGKLPSADLEVFFDYDKAEITPAARQVLGPLGQALINQSWLAVDLCWRDY